MNARTFLTASALVLAAGGAVAAQPQPFAGEAPFAVADTTSVSAVSREAVRAQALAARDQIDSGDVVHTAVSAPVASPSRAAVRAQAREALFAGHGPAAGELS